MIYVGTGVLGVAVNVVRWGPSSMAMAQARHIIISFRWIGFGHRRGRRGGGGGELGVGGNPKSSSRPQEVGIFRNPLPFVRGEEGGRVS